MTPPRHILGRGTVLAAVALLWLALASPAMAQTTDPRTLLDGLRSLALEARIELQIGPAATTPKLFTQAVPDGRSWMSYIADTLGAAAGGDTAQPAPPNEWAMLDDAVSLVLAEAEAMKALAASRAGTPDEAKFQNARRLYLAGAARLLKFYRVAAGDVFNSTGGTLLDPLGLPDWLLPGEVQLKEISGTGRLNTDSGDFSGRLSGTMLLPGLGATLVVPNASFDSDGRFDLSAYGSVPLPFGVLSVPPRQPLHYRSTPERGQLLEGSARLTLTNGLRFDASILLADLNYCFGLAARGLEFDLGKSLLVRVPTLNLNQVNAFGDAARDAFADYFLGLNGAMETLVSAATNFPPIHETEFGQPPDFKPPQITADFSVLNAWSAEIIAKTRAGLSNAQQSLQPVLDSLAKLNADAREATNALADERFRLGNLAARFDLRQRMKEAAELAAAQQLSGNADISRLQQELVAGARQEGSNIVALITPELPDRLGESAEILRLLLENASTFQRLGINPPQPALPSDPCVACRAPEAAPQQRAEALALCAARRQAARFGLNPLTGGIASQTVFESLPETELYRAGRILAEMEAALTLQGVPVQGSFTQLLGPILNRQRELLLRALESESSLQRSFELITLIGDNFADRDRKSVV